MMKRVYSDPVFQSDLAAVIHGNDSEHETMKTCPCCGTTTSAGEKAQAMYYSMLDDLYMLLINDNEFRRIKAATKLITRLNEMINTTVSKGLDSSIDHGTAKTKRINIMIKNLLEVRK